METLNSKVVVGDIIIIRVANGGEGIKAIDRPLMVISNDGDIVDGIIFLDSSDHVLPWVKNKFFMVPPDRSVYVRQVKRGFMEGEWRLKG